MGSLNKACLLGHLGRDAELRYTPGGTPLAKFSLATTETWTDKAGQRQEKTEWHYVALWGKSAETLAQYLTKGKQVYVEGRIETHEYTDKQGVKQKSTEIRGDKVVLLGGQGGGERRGGGRAPARSADRGGHVSDEAMAAEMDLPPDDVPADPPLTDDDIPF